MKHRIAVSVGPHNNDHQSGSDKDFVKGELQPCASDAEGALFLSHLFVYLQKQCKQGAHAHS